MQRKSDALQRMGHGAIGLGDNILHDHLVNFRADIYNELEDEMQTKFEQLRVESQSSLRVRKDNFYQEQDIQEERYRQRFLANTKELRDSKEIFSK